MRFVLFLPSKDSFSDFFLWIESQNSTDFTMIIYWRYWFAPEVDLLEYDGVIKFPSSKGNYILDTQNEYLTG